MYLFVYGLRNNSMFSSVSECKESNGKAVSEKWIGCSIQTCTLDGYLHRVILYQTSYWYNWFSWWWAQECSKHVENWNKYIREKNCASSWLFTRNI